MDVKKTRNALGRKSLLEIVDKVRGRSFIGYGTRDRWNFQKAIQTAHNVINLDAFFHWSVVPDPSSRTRYIIQVNSLYYFVCCKRFNY